MEIKKHYIVNEKDERIAVQIDAESFFESLEILHEELKQAGYHFRRKEDIDQDMREERETWK